MIEKHLLRDIIHVHHQTHIKADQFFISWNGVPTLAYRGFSPVLLGIKQAITSRVPYLCKENPGSGWPKTTLGALYDDKTLSMKDLRVLRDICDTMNPGLEHLVIPIQRLEIVIYYCRSLEQRLLTESIPLAAPEDTSPPPRDHLDEVSGIMNQFSRDNLPAYLPYVQRKGHRESHYRDPVIEATLIHDLAGTPGNVEIFGKIVQLREEVNRRLPGMFCWFDDKSLHITVKALS
jgi:hypothetical protein